MRYYYDNKDDNWYGHPYKSSVNNNKSSYDNNSGVPDVISCSSESSYDDDDNDALILTVTTATKYNENQGVYVSSDKEEEETDDNDSGVYSFSDEEEDSDNDKDYYVNNDKCSRNNNSGGPDVISCSLESSYEWGDCDDPKSDCNAEDRYNQYKWKQKIEKDRYNQYKQKHQMENPELYRLKFILDNQQRFLRLHTYLQSIPKLSNYLSHGQINYFHDDSDENDSNEVDSHIEYNYWTWLWN